MYLKENIYVRIIEWLRMLIQTRRASLHLGHTCGSTVLELQHTVVAYIYACLVMKQWI